MCVHHWQLITVPAYPHNWKSFDNIFLDSNAIVVMMRCEVAKSVSLLFLFSVYYNIILKMKFVHSLYNYYVKRRYRGYYFELLEVGLKTSRLSDLVVSYYFYSYYICIILEYFCCIRYSIWITTWMKESMCVLCVIQITCTSNHYCSWPRDQQYGQNHGNLTNLTY